MTPDVPGLDAALHAEASRLAGYSMATHGSFLADLLQLLLSGAGIAGVALALLLWLNHRR